MRQTASPTHRQISNLATAFFLVVAMVAIAPPVQASHEEICYVFADSGNRLGLLDRSTGTETPLPNPAGVPDIETIELDPITGILYAIDADELGILDQSTGIYSPVGFIGSGNGASGTIAMSDVDSMALDSAGNLWAVNASSGSDELFRINKTTGAIVLGFFGAGIDYLPVSGRFDQIDDIGIDPGTGIMYGIHTSTTNDQIVTINTTTGAATAVGASGSGIADMEGMTFDTSSQLIGTTGNAGPTATRDRFYRVSKTTGVATFEVALGASGSDYESVSCMTQAIDVSDLELTKDVSNPTPASGEIITYTVSVTNQGEDPATGVEVTDQLPPGLLYVSDDSGGAYTPGTGVWVIGSLGVSATATLQIQAQVVGSGTIVNVAEVSASNSVDPDSFPNNDDGDQSEDDEDNASIMAPTAADLELTKSVSDPTPDIGDTVTFTVNVTNQGDDAASAISVEDVVPAGYSNVTNISNGGTVVGSTITWTEISLGDGASINLTFEADVNAPTGTTGEYVNVAQVTASSQPDPDSTPNNDDGDQSEDDEDNASVVPSNVADLELVKTVDDTTPMVGDTVTFTVTLTNQGPAAATGVSVEDLVPAGYSNIANASNGGTAVGSTITWTGLTLANGASVDLTFEADVDTPTGAINEFLNVAQVTASDQFDTDSTPDNDDGDQSEDDEDNAAVTPAELGIAKAVAAVINNTDGTYTVSYLVNIENLGTVTVDDLVVTDDLITQLAVILPTGFMAISGSLNANAAWDGLASTNILDAGQSLDAGESGTVIIQVTVTPAGDLGPHFNQADVSGTTPGGTPVSDTSTNGDDPDPNGDGNPDEDDPTPVVFTESPSIGLAKDLTAGPTSVGGGVFTLTFTLLVENTGDVALDQVQVVDDLTTTFAGAAGFTVVSTSSPDLTINSGYDGSTDINLLDSSDGLAVDGTGTIIVELEVTPGPNVGPYDNSATAEGVSPNNSVVTDVSQDGTDVDPDSNGDPTDNNVPTEVLFPAPGAVEGRLWLDDDRDGIQDGGEPGLAGVTLNLIDPGADGVVGGGDDSIVATTTTDANGDYGFDDLEPGSYFVVIDTATLPSNIQQVFDPDGTFDNATAVTVVAGQTDTANDFGYDNSAFDLAVTKKATGPDGDGTIVWEIIVSNNGPDPAPPPITLVDVLPATLDIEMVNAPSGWMCSASGQRIECITNMAMAAGDAATIRIETTVDAADGSVIQNQADVSATGVEVTLANNTDIATVTVGQLPFTGLTLDRFVIVSAELVILGALLLAAGRRRRAS